MTIQRKKLPDANYLRQALSYCKETGLFKWKKRPIGHFTCKKNAARWNGKNAGKAAFISKSTHGYRHGSIDGVRYFAHRVAWKIVTGEEPPKVLDHINGDAADNSFKNLRACSYSENSQNKQYTVRQSSVFKGVCWKPQSKKWQATIYINGKQKYLGIFATEIEAAKAYDNAAYCYFGEFARLNAMSQHYRSDGVYLTDPELAKWEQNE